ncbi:unnamed protein product [Arabis nemorensis]|uniref:Auxin response factor n=1 Tax=Arabis nemorensis TaxID=586526 RepID=A0A565APK3_9BRAS|nr:unnamed protein product [Arabis nemorensis]
MALPANVESTVAMSKALYTELWNACAGPLVTLPRKGERVYYFPEGHMEQLEASMNQRLDQQMPSFDLSSKILCEVTNVERMVELGTDEVFAEISLVPKEDEIAPIIPSVPVPEKKNLNVQTFCKTLTTSDAGKRNGFPVPMRLAKNCFPPLKISKEKKKEAPSQYLVPTDLQQKKWSFHHIFYKGKSNRHMLNAGWNNFVDSKMLVAGDVLIFARQVLVDFLAANGDLGIGVRRVMRQQVNMPSSVISTESMHFGVLANTAHSIKTRSVFKIFVKPRISRPEIVVSVNRYNDSKNQQLSVGMRFKMRFEGENTHEKMFTGTIVGVQENTSQVWTDSEWRALKVQWDEPSSVFRPERVSHWEIELLVGNNNVPSPQSQPRQRNKRSRTLGVPSPTAGPSASGPAGSLSAVTLFRPSATFGHGGRSLSLWPNRVDIGAETYTSAFVKYSAVKKQARGNSCRLFGVELVENNKTPECFSPVTVPVAAGVDQLAAGMVATTTEERLEK